MDIPTQLVELQRENERLSKEMEAKEAKLNSSMRSIKMFWSPELKKERAARKSEAEKYAQLKEQFNVVSKESQVLYKQLKLTKLFLWFYLQFLLSFQYLFGGNHYIWDEELILSNLNSK